MKKRKREIWRTRRERGGGGCGCGGGHGRRGYMVRVFVWYSLPVVGFMWVTGVVVNALEPFESLKFFR